MAGTGVTLYSTTSAGNKTVIGTIDWREDVYMPSQINDNVGQIMADIRAMANAIATGWIEVGDGEGTYTATYVSATSFRFDGVDVTAYYRAGMRVRVVAPTPGIISGTITSSTFSTHTTLVVAWDSGSLSNEAITSVSLGIGSSGGAGSQRSYRNILGRNGGFEVWQRGAGGGASIGIPASTPQYTADGWYFYNGANQASVVTQGGGQTNGSLFALLAQRNAGQTGTGAMHLEFPMDTDEVAQMRNSIVTLSLSLRAGANWSPAGGNIQVRVVTGTGAPVRLTTGAYTGSVNVIDVTQALTLGGESSRYFFTSFVATAMSITQGCVLLSWTPVGTAGPSDYVYVDDVQLEVGGAVSDFERRPFEVELLACQRHYEKSYDYAAVPGSSTAAGSNMLQVYVAANTEWMYQPYAVKKRTTPTVTVYSTTGAAGFVRNIAAGADVAATVSASGERAFSISFNAAASIFKHQYAADAGI